MRRGTTTMKMINNTSTTSTSGVMLISDCRPGPESPLLNCMPSLPPRAGAFRDEPNAAEPGLFNSDHGFAHLSKVEPCIAADHDLGICFGAHRGAKRIAELFRCDLLIVDPHPACF